MENVVNFAKNKSYIKKLAYYIFSIKNSLHQQYTFFNLAVIICVSMLLSVITFIFSYQLIGLVSSAILLSSFSLFLPFFIIQWVDHSIKRKIQEIFPTYAITLKTYTQVTNDIVIAFRKAKTQRPLSIFIDKFNISIEKGLNVYDAFENLKKDIHIKKINEFLTAAQVCYINGGDFTILLDQYAKILSKINLQREKDKQENYVTIIIFFILVVINIYFLINFVFLNDEYRQIILHTLMGKVILNSNLLSYIIIFLFAQKMNQMEE